MQPIVGEVVHKGGEDFNWYHTMYHFKINTVIINTIQKNHQISDLLVFSRKYSLSTSRNKTKMFSTKFVSPSQCYQLKSSPALSAVSAPTMTKSFTVSQRRATWIVSGCFVKFEDF